MCLCATVESGAASAPQLLKWVWGRATRPARRDGLGGKETEIGGAAESLYYKQPRTCCNHLETMAHRSVRLAKRPGPHNSRDASSTTLRAIVGPLRFLVCFFPPTDEFLLTATGPATSITRRVSCRARGNADDWNRLFQRNARIKHSTIWVVSGNGGFYESRKQKIKFHPYRRALFHLKLVKLVYSVSFRRKLKRLRVGKTWEN